MPQPRASGSSGPSGPQAATPPPSSSSITAPPPAAAQERTRRRHHHHHNLVVLSILAFLVALACPVLAAPTRAENADAKQLLHRALPDDPTQWTKRDTREAFARIVDPLAPWGVGTGVVAANSAAGRGAGVVEGENSGWLTHWLSMGGEGVLTVMLGDDNVNDDSNITLPHRPAAFPSYLSASSDLPVNGTLVPFASLPEPTSPEHGDAEDNSAHGSWHGENKADDDGGLGPTLPRERACLPPAWPPIRPRAPKAPYLVVLVERGGCDFATKVRAAQERGAAAVVVGDGVARAGETDEEGRRRENLITMFSPEDTSGVIIPSVFVSRASYLALRDLLANHTIDGRPGLRVEVGEAADDGNALGSLLTFALLMPSLFLLATVAAHRVRVARQREANRAPPTVVLSLPERVWSPDIVWEKDDSDDSDKEPAAPTPAPAPAPATAAADVPAVTASEAVVTGASPSVVDSANESPAADADDEADPPAAAAPPSATSAAAGPRTSRKRGKERRKSQKYYSKDECAICMDNFHRGEIVRILPCGHVFHKDECDEWLLKWRKLCPTCRADVTLPPGDLSSSATLTPVVDRTAAPTAGAAERGRAGYGAVDGGNTDSDEGEGGWGDQLAAGIQSVQTRVGAATRWVGESFRAVVRRGDTGGADGGASGAGGGGQRDERMPLVGAGGA